jgi:serine protease Do
MEGVLIPDVIEGSPADKAGIKPGDVLLAYGEANLSAERDDDLNKLTLLVAQTPVGAEKILTVFRDGRPMTLKVMVGEQPKVKADELETQFGFTVKEITDDMYRTYLLGTREGVFVSFVDVGTVADKGDLMDGDVITAVNNITTSNFKSFKETIGQAAGDDFILLSVLRGKERKLALLDRTGPLSTDVAVDPHDPADTLKGQ